MEEKPIYNMQEGTYIVRSYNDGLYYKDSNNITRAYPVMAASQLFLDFDSIKDFEKRKNAVLRMVTEIEHWAAEDKKRHWRLIASIVHSAKEGDFPISNENKGDIIEKFKDRNLAVL